MISEFNVQINKEAIYRRLHLEENTESFRNAEGYFDHICDIIKENMKPAGFYCVVSTSSEPSIEKIAAKTGISYWALCLISSRDNIADSVNLMMSSGEYLKGYLLNEAAADAFFNASCQLNHMADMSLRSMGLIKTRRYAPGDGFVDLKHQEDLLNVLKKHVETDVCLNEFHVLIPERSMLYMFGLEKCKTPVDVGIRTGEGENISGDNGCESCSNLKCSYRNNGMSDE